MLNQMIFPGEAMHASTAAPSSGTVMQNGSIFRRVSFVMAVEVERTGADVVATFVEAMVLGRWLVG